MAATVKQANAKKAKAQQTHKVSIAKPNGWTALRNISRQEVLECMRTNKGVCY